MVRKLYTRVSILGLFVTLISSCGMPGLTAKVERGITEAPPDTQSLTGSYYMGDGLGVNVYLTLKPDSLYEAEWHGCLGKYGEGSGTWQVSDTLLVLTPSSEEGMLAGYLRTLIIQRYKGSWIFVRADITDQKDYRKHGVSRLTCLQREKVP